MFSATSSSIARRMVPMLVPQRSESSALGWNGVAGLPLAAGQRFGEPAFHVLVQRARERYAGCGVAWRVGHGTRVANDGASAVRKAPARCRQV